MPLTKITKIAVIIAIFIPYFKERENNLKITLAPLDPLDNHA